MYCDRPFTRIDIIIIHCIILYYIGKRKINGYLYTYIHIKSILPAVSDINRTSICRLLVHSNSNGPDIIPWCSGKKKIGL